ncbi:MAG: hypothetical protein ACRC67_43655 [Inquilinus sp.]|uniref:hypothetical protein n=1 Tax=Inquilinus sp. TaxID=1932117 RepID=UPI003F31B22D
MTSAWSTLRTFTRQVRDAGAAVVAAEAEFARCAVADGMQAWEALKAARAHLDGLKREAESREFDELIGGKPDRDGIVMDIHRAIRLYGSAVATLERHISRNGSALCKRGLACAEESLRLNRDRLEKVQRRMLRGQADWSATAPKVAG